MPEFLQQLEQPLLALPLAFALGIVAIPDIRVMIRLYQIQSIVLAGIAVVTAIIPVLEEHPFQALLTLPAMLPPLFLAATVEFMLARATIPPQEADKPHYLKREYWRSLLPRAAAIWLRHGPTRVSPVVGFINFALVMGTYVAAFGLTHSTDSPRLFEFSLMIALGLLMLGLLALGTQGNLIAQVMGLLVAEHGLFLAVVRIVSGLAVPLFVASLFLYILLTLMILLVLLPDLRRASESIDVNDQRELRG
ncbi:MAG TPA: hypothetical protein VJG32_16540 [Anaerolineae bacterium]|nr:hypothetical protein [Anaerolineae bacterium]